MRRRPPPLSSTTPVPGRAPAWQRRYRRHRRVLAALLVGVVVWSVASAVRPPAPRSTLTLVARHDLVPGAALTSGDVGLELRPSTGLPADALAGAEVVTGRTIAFPVRAGEPVTARHVVASALLAALGPDTVATPVHLADASAAGLLEAGDVVDVIAAAAGDSSAGSATAAVVASGVRVLVAPGSSSGSNGGLLGSPVSSARDGASLVLATTTAQSLAIARSAVASRLSVTVRAAP